MLDGTGRVPYTERILAVGAEAGGTANRRRCGGRQMTPEDNETRCTRVADAVEAVLKRRVTRFRAGVPNTVRLRQRNA